MQRGKPASMRDREQIKRLAEAGNSQRAIARQLGVHRQTVKKYAPKT